VRIENLVGTAAEIAGRTLKDKANYVSIVRAGVWGTV
jgi:hypothetical protein